MKHFFSIVFSLAFISPVLAQDIPITEKQVKSFLEKNRSNLLIKYQCLEKQALSNCKVVCSSGGNKLIEVSHVKNAYYAERLKRLDKSLGGFFLIVDADDSQKGRDLWATLQTESSCYFEGLTPQF